MESVREKRVVHLGAQCDLESEGDQQANFRIAEFAVLDDDTELLLHSERGVSIRLTSPSGIWASQSQELLERSVMTAVLPDDAEDSGEEHPWDWIRVLLAAKGVVTTVEHLEAVPYIVRFGTTVQARFGTTVQEGPEHAE